MCFLDIKPCETSARAIFLDIIAVIIAIQHYIGTVDTSDGFEQKLFAYFWTGRAAGLIVGSILSRGAGVCSPSQAVKLVQTEYKQYSS